MVDKYINTKYGSGSVNDGDNIKSITKTISLDTSNAIGDIFRVATLPSIARILRITIGCTAITGCSDVDLGLYEPNNGDVVDADLLMDGQTLATTSKVLDGIKDVSIANADKNLIDLNKSVNSSSAFDNKFIDVALTLNSAPTAAGIVSIKIEYVI